MSIQEAAFRKMRKAKAEKPPVGDVDLTPVRAMIHRGVRALGGPPGPRYDGPGAAELARALSMARAGVDAPGPPEDLVRETLRDSWREFGM